jgi:hypothetical protein
LIKNGIFIERGLRDKFYEIDKLMLGAVAEQRMNLQNQNQLGWKWEKVAALNKQGQDFIDDLERKVQARLWNADSIK